MATSFEVAVDPQRDRLARPTWVQWPVYWSAVWVGALSAFAVALLIGLIASVIGGWLASGEPMNFTHYRTRNLTTTGTTQPRL